MTPSPQTNDDRARSEKIIDPTAYFSSWFFRIDSHHFEILGMSYKKFMKNKTPYWAWSKMNPIEYRFQQGYIFYARDDSNHFLQVVADWDSFKIEVHEGRATGDSLRHACAIGADEFADWLKTGRQPLQSLKLDTANSKAGILAWHIKPDNF